MRRREHGGPQGQSTRMMALESTPRFIIELVIVLCKYYWVWNLYSDENIQEYMTKSSCGFDLKLELILKN